MASQDEINRQVEARKRSNPNAQRSKTIATISQLVSSLDLAIRRDDAAAVASLNQQIIALGGDPSTGNLVSEAIALGSEHDDRIEKINENARRKTKGSMAAAHLASVARRKAENAIIKARQ